MTRKNSATMRAESEVLHDSQRADWIEERFMESCLNLLQRDTTRRGPFNITDNDLKLLSGSLPRRS
jgi:hypothetical protein